MNYTQRETEDWKARFGKKKSFRPMKKRPDQLPGNILIVDIATGEYKEVKPVFKKPVKAVNRKVKKNRRSKKRVKK